jgi:hypothetical protein
MEQITQENISNLVVDKNTKIIKKVYPNLVF